MTSTRQIRIASSKSTETEETGRKSLLRLLRDSPVHDDEILRNMGLFLNRQALSRIVTMHDLYKKVLDVHGVVMEFGVRWGQNLALFESFRGMYEPFNHNRKIIGFDTFEGFAGISDKDGDDRIAANGSYAVTEGYEAYLAQVLDYHESESPIAHLKKYELVKGDASETLERYLRDNPQTIVALAYFDLDIYEPTKNCLALIRDHVTKGTVIGFDELNNSVFPGETLALAEVLGLANVAIRRFPNSSDASYIVIE